MIVQTKIIIQCVVYNIYKGKWMSTIAQKPGKEMEDSSVRFLYYTRIDTISLKGRW